MKTPKEILTEKITNKTTRALGIIIRSRPDIIEFLKSECPNIKSDNAMELLYNWWYKPETSICHSCNKQMKFSNFRDGYKCSILCKYKIHFDNLYNTSVSESYVPKMTKDMLIQNINIISNNTSLDKISTIMKNSYIHLTIDLLYYTKFLDKNATINERIYCLKNNITEKTKCVTCNKKYVKFNPMIMKYRYCSIKCSANNIDILNKRKNTSDLKYGKDNYMNRIKAIENLRNKTDEENAKMIKKVKKTKLEKYGDENYHNKEQARLTCLEKYGVEYTTQTEEMKRKGKETKIARYGEDYGSIIFKKVADTLEQKTGYRNPSHIPEVMLKAQNTLMEKYNVTNAFHVAKNSPFASRVSQSLFDIIYAQLDENRKKHCQYRNLNSEYILKPLNKRKPFSFDFVMLDNKKCIEFNGDFWHMNPKLYESTDLNKITKKTAEEHWKQDEEKMELIKSFGFDVFVIWENEYYENPNKIIEECLNFIKL